MVGSIVVETKVAFGYLATSKKSGVFKCLVRPSSSVTTDAVSIVIETTLCAGSLFSKSIVPPNCLNEPLWLLVTLAATNSTFEFSGLIVNFSPPAGLAVFDSGAAFPTDAFGLLAAGLAHP